MESHVSYGTGPIGVLGPIMGPVPKVLQRCTWDRSHRVLRSIYGTDPIGTYEPSMGLHFLKFLHKALLLTHATGPIGI